MVKHLAHKPGIGIVQEPHLHSLRSKANIQLQSLSMSDQDSYSSGPLIFPGIVLIKQFADQYILISDLDSFLPSI